VVLFFFTGKKDNKCQLGNTWGGVANTCQDTSRDGRPKWGERFMRDRRPEGLANNKKRDKSDAERNGKKTGSPAKEGELQQLPGKVCPVGPHGEAWGTLGQF